MRNPVQRQRQNYTQHNHFCVQYSAQPGSADRPPTRDESAVIVPLLVPLVASTGKIKQRESTFSVIPVFSVLPWRLSSRQVALEDEERGPKRERNLGPAPAVPAEISGEFLCTDGRQAPPRLLQSAA